jgi:hypothetical protein
MPLSAAAAGGYVVVANSKLSGLRLIGYKDTKKILNPQGFI